MVAVADRVLADPIAVSVLSSRATLDMKSKRAKLFLIPEEYSPPCVLLATEQYLQLNRRRTLTNGFMHAVVNPSFNALSTSLATSRHHLRVVIERNREARVNEALDLGPKKLVRDKRLELLSDPVALSRLHQRICQQPESAVWREHYQ